MQGKPMIGGTPKSTATTITVEVLAEERWSLLRDLRLAALADAPNAFWATLEQEGRYGRKEWTAFVRAVRWFVASRNKEPVGLLGVMQRPEIPGEPEVIGLWVAPHERRVGIASNLVAAACAWARQQDAESLALWVVDSNAEARRLYEHHGFVTTGERAALPPDRAGFEERMRRIIQQPSATEGKSS